MINYSVAIFEQVRARAPCRAFPQKMRPGGHRKKIPANDCQRHFDRIDKAPFRKTLKTTAIPDDINIKTE
jgi:hypothetical protein